MAIEVLLWDFGDTLCDERFMRLSHPRCADWPGAWESVMARHAHGWNIGAVDWRVVSAELARASSLDPQAVEDHATACCERIVFFSKAWAAAQTRIRRQALVTINPDLFIDRVVPLHRLNSIFDEIVVSASEGTVNKADLCDLALERLQYTGSRSQVLLIDNSSPNVDEWSARGGTAYLFSSDEQLATDWDSLLT